MKGTDLIRKKQAEAKLIDSNNYIATIIKSSYDSIFVVDTVGRFEFGNEAFYRVLGYPENEIIGQTFMKVIHPDYHDFIQQRWDEIQKGEGRPYEVDIVRKDGTVRSLYVSHADMEIGGKRKYCVIAKDITDRKSSEDRIRLQSKILETMEEGVFLVRASDSIIVYVNSGFERMFGYQAEEIVGKHVSVINAPSEKEPQEMASKIMKALSENGEWKGEISNIKKDGTEFWCNANVLAFQHPIHGKVWIAVHTDITDRRKVEGALSESEKHLRTVITNAPIVLFALDREGLFTFSEGKALERLGLQPGQAVGKSIYYMYSDLPEAVASFQYALAGETSRKIFEGGGFAFETIYSPLRDQNGDIIGVTGVGIDITERKRVEEALSKSEKDLKEAQRLAKIGSWDWDATTDTITWSEEYYHIYGFDPTQRPAGYEDHLKAYTPESEALLDAAVKRNMQNGESYGLDLELARTEGPRRWITARSETKRNAQGQIIGLRGTAQDITERKRAEEYMKNSLKEKEILLKEIHHRVKNNLQVISSLLYLQSKKLSDAKSLEVFNEGQNRIRSMVLVHEQLYKSGDLARINFDKYIHELAHSLSLSYGSTPITFIIDIDGVYLGVDQAIPCGLILNELISNALKHAFTPGKQGQIEIDLRTDNSDYLTLTVKDNGVGFPKNLDFRNTTSLGLNIINKLVNQLKGTIELDTNAGTEFMIRFPNQNKI